MSPMPRPPIRLLVPLLLLSALAVGTSLLPTAESRAAPQEPATDEAATQAPEGEGSAPQAEEEAPETTAADAGEEGSTDAMVESPDEAGDPGGRATTAETAETSSGGRLDAAQVRGQGPETVHQTWIEASWDPEEAIITGRETLQWRNTSSVPVESLCFHHYLNAFSSNRTTFMRESGGQLRGDRFEGDRWGWIETDSVTLADGTELKDEERYVAPDDGNPHDRTVAMYPLPEPVPPGGVVTVEIAFRSKMPSIFARTGAEGDYVLAGQWFPKIGVFQDAGEAGRREVGWNCHQFHAHSEFFADFGDFDVTLDLPGRYAGKVGATGVLVSENVSEGRVRARFVQRGVHDFAWTGDPDFEVVSGHFEPDRDVPQEMRRTWSELLGVAEEELALDPVELTLLVQPEHRDQAERYLGAARAAIRGYGLRLGAYPYTTLTLVDPPRGAMGSGGMEYPTFITLGTSVLLDVPPFDGVLLPEIVTVHEFGHQYFQGMIASNEFEESWIDEGINSYYESLVMEDEYPPPLRFLSFSLSPFEMHRMRLGSGRYSDPVATPSWGFLTGTSYGINSYPRPSVTLHHLQRLLGTESFHRAMRAFFQRYRFEQPTTEDFERTLEEATGEELGWFFDQALHSTRRLDYELLTASSEEVPEAEGVFWRQGERVEVGDGEPDEYEGFVPRLRRLISGDGTGDEKEAGDGAETFVEGGEDSDEELHRSRVTVYRRGEFLHPVTVEMRFEGGTVLRRTWDGETRWARWTFVTDRPLVSAQVDPDHVLALDLDRLNNSRRVERDRRPRYKVLTDLLFWLQTWLTSGGLFA